MNAPSETLFLHPETPFLKLSQPFVEQVKTHPLPEPYWISWNSHLAKSLHLSLEATPAWLNVCAGRVNQAWCSVYSGHQFGVWAGQLGDGRAHLLGSVNTIDQALEIQIKGAGLTPFSRMGDGRAVLRSSIREYLASEAMAALQIPTTRALALVGSTLPVQRERWESAAIVTRLAPSFIRFGHIEHFAHRGDIAHVVTLLDYIIEQHYPQLLESDTPYIDLFEQMVSHTARLIAQWQAVGFCHGVMNTDNMSVLGITLDYGPYGFLDHFDWQHRCNHTDHQGRYAYINQPHAAYWNCAALASAFWPLIADENLLSDRLERFHERYQWSYLQLFRKKLGLQQAKADDSALIQDLLDLLHQHRVDFTLFFRLLSDLSLTDSARDATLLAPLDRSVSLFNLWLQRYRQRLIEEESQDSARHPLMRRTNPRFVLRNYLAQEAIDKATQGDFSMIKSLQEVLHSPFDEHPEFSSWAELPPAWSSSISVSCSS
ncbi:MAG: YdiU family protein [Betaproteobacteria bacterium]|nr:YdiU family protein [Betaproteobacteria bacterium]MDE2422728.1 YdiU family protein [Betaproteobacteria bacterium]